MGAGSLVITVVVHTFIIIREIIYVFKAVRRGEALGGASLPKR